MNMHEIVIAQKMIKQNQKNIMKITKKGYNVNFTIIKIQF